MTTTWGWTDPPPKRSHGGVGFVIRHGDIDDGDDDDDGGGDDDDDDNDDDDDDADDNDDDIDGNDHKISILVNVVMYYCREWRTTETKCRKRCNILWESHDEKQPIPENEIRTMMKLWGVFFSSGIFFEEVLMQIWME